MDRRPTKLETVKEEGWHIMSGRWWQTSYHSVPWMYSPDRAESTIAKPPHYHGDLFCTSGRRLQSADASVQNQLDSVAHEAALVLNPKLCGVQCALDVITAYEAFVGIISINTVTAPGHLSMRQRDISVEVTEKDLTSTKGWWNKFTEDLFTFPLTPISDTCATEEPPSPSSPGDLYHSMSTLSSDLTDSDLSCNSASSRPTTPKRKDIEPAIQINDSSPLKSPYCGRPLNAFASSFVPSFRAGKPGGSYDSTSPPSTFADIPFPLEVPAVPLIKLKKDDQGFYSKDEIESPLPESAFLPPFLQKPPSRRKTVASKTRAIIDRFRSSQNEGLGASQSHCPSPNPPLYDHSLFEERISVSEDGRSRSGQSTPASFTVEDGDGDGWVNVSEPAPRAFQQTRNLFIAFTRRRSGSSSPPHNDVRAHSDTAMAIPAAPSPSPLPPPLPYATNDGWVEGVSASSSPKRDPQPGRTLAPIPPPAARRTKSRSRSGRRRRTSHAPPAAHAPIPVPVPVPTASAQYMPPPPPTSFPPFPTVATTPYLYSAYPTLMTPTMAYTTYIQQLQLQMTQHLRSGATGTRKSATVATTTTGGEFFSFPGNPKPFTTFFCPNPLS